MRKFLLGLVCVLVVVGVASMGHAGLFGFFGGGGGGGKKHQDSTQRFDFHQFVVQPPTQNPGTNDSESFNFQEYLKGPVPADPYAGNHDNAQQQINDVVSEVVPGPVETETNGTGYLAQNTTPAQNGTPVPEPATMILLGIGLIGLAGYGTRKFKG